MPHLIEAERFDDALHLLERACQSIRHREDWLALRAALALLPNRLLIGAQTARRLRLEVLTLVGVRDVNGVLEFSAEWLERLQVGLQTHRRFGGLRAAQKVNLRLPKPEETSAEIPTPEPDSPEAGSPEAGSPEAGALEAGALGPEIWAVIASARAWALLAGGRPAEASALLALAVPLLTTSDLGAALKRLAQAQSALGLPWVETALRARSLLEGRALGLALIDEGYLHQHAGEPHRARECLNMSLGLLAQDRFHLAWARHNLTEVALAHGDPDAERHALEAERLSRHPQARSLRSRALNGLAGVRRRQGDLRRAEDACRAAVRAAIEADDRLAALWSLARTQRLAARPHAALESLHTALASLDPHFERGPVPTVEPGGDDRTRAEVQHPLRVELAAIWTALDQSARALRLLGSASGLSQRHADLWRIVRAELHRRAGEGIAALQCLLPLRPETPLLLEEAPMWPELFTLAALSGRPLVQRSVFERSPLAEPLMVEVDACGPLRVRVNRHPVRLSPTGRPAELLVLLLELHGCAPVETLIDRLWPRESRPECKRQALWQLAKKLRLALGWQQSLTVQDRLYTLDLRAVWRYDAREARSRREASGAFLEGVHSDWALEVGRELESLGPPQSGFGLN